MIGMMKRHRRQTQRRKRAKFLAMRIVADEKFYGPVWNTPPIKYILLQRYESPVYVWWD
jgi:hypothetical protein